MPVVSAIERKCPRKDSDGSSTAWYPVIAVIVYPDVFCRWMGELPPVSKDQQSMDPSSQEVKTTEALESDQHPPVRPASPLDLTISGC